MLPQSPCVDVMESLKSWLCLAVVSVLCCSMNAYRPVIMMHGVLSGPLDMAALVGFITEAHPGTAVTNVDAYSDAGSVFNNMDVQVEGVWKKIEPIVSAATDGVNMICYSQGGLICRGILERYSVPVKSFISLSSPQAGQYGDTQFVNYLFPNKTREILYELFYTTDAQRDISIANYWNDPLHQQLYYKYCKFLPSLNNGSSIYRKNFLEIQQLVLIGGPHDGVITPWQSSQFGFYDEKLNIVTYTSQKFYLEDSFGLQTLDKSGRVKIVSVSGVEHLDWPFNKAVFTNHIEPYLS